MSRPISGKITTSLMRQKQKNGDIYVYERQTQYDPVKRNTKTLSYKLIGKIPAGQMEMVPTRHRQNKKASDTSVLCASSRHVGATDILEWVGQESGIDDDLRDYLDEDTANMIITIARYWLANPSQTLARIGKWQRTHITPCPFEITRGRYHTLFEYLGTNVGTQEAFFKRRAARAGDGDGDVLAYDSTTVSTYSTHLHDARQGFNKAHDGLDTIKLLTLFSLKTRQPIFVTKQPGNLNDVTSVRNILTRLSWLEEKKVQVVTDNGYFSQGNIGEFSQAHVKFLTLGNLDISWIAPELDKHRDELLTASSICPWDLSIHGIQVMVKPHLKWTRRKQLSNGEIKETQMTVEPRLYLYFFKNQDNIARDEKRLMKKAVEIREQLQRGETEFSVSALNFIDKYMKLSTRGRGGELKIEYNEEAFAKARQNFGYFALVSNKKLDTFEALRRYRMREKIEEGFRTQKSEFDGDRPRVWYDDNFKGRIFCQFVALGYWCFLRDAINDVKTRLQHKEPDEMKQTTDLKKSLLHWLQQRSMVDVLDWFDSIELTRLMSETDRLVKTEMTLKDQLFLKMLKESDPKRAADLPPATDLSDENDYDDEPCPPEANEALAC